MDNGDVAQAAYDYIAGAEASETEANPIAQLDTLKIAEYALLAGPVTRGVEAHLEDPQLPFRAMGQYSLGDIAQGVGMSVFNHTWRLLSNNGEVLDLATRLADLRGGITANPAYARLIAPLRRTFQAAALASAHTMGVEVCANAFTILRDAPELPHDEQVAATRASHQLALAHPLVHIANTNTIGLITIAYNKAILWEREFREDLLRFDPATRKVVLTKGLHQWHVKSHVKSNLTTADVEAASEDVRIGCPFSFAPQDIRVAYYEDMVDLIEVNGQWPELLSSMIES